MEPAVMRAGLGDRREICPARVTIAIQLRKQAEESSEGADTAYGRFSLAANTVFASRAIGT